MVRASLLVALVAAVAWSAAAAPRSTLSERELLESNVLGLELAAAPSLVPAADEVFGIDDEMQAFLAPIVAVRDPTQRLTALLTGMQEYGLFSLDYAETTRIASATFHERQGNCLSFTLLFVALARAAGLKAAYQTVDVPPSWSNDGRIVIANHVNAVVQTNFGEKTTVDFNIRDYRGVKRSRQISDEHALALFYTNVGAEALLRREYAAGFAALRAAARIEPDLPGAWVNLGVLYARQERYDYAEAAYLRALDADSNEQSAVVNLVLVEVALGNEALAEEYRREVQRYREQNPYYHFGLATAAYAADRLLDARASLRRALRLKRDEHQFYELNARVMQSLGRRREAEQNAERAHYYAELKSRKASSLVRLESVAVR